MKLKDVEITPGLIHQRPFKGSKIGDFFKAGKSQSGFKYFKIRKFGGGNVASLHSQLQIKEIFRVM